MGNQRLETEIVEIVRAPLKLTRVEKKEQIREIISRIIYIIV